MQLLFLDKDRCNFPLVKTLYILFLKNKVLRLGDDTTIIGENKKVRNQLNICESKYKSYSDYMPHAFTSHTEVENDIEQKGYELSRKWYFSDNSKDISQLGKYSLGECLGHNIYKSHFLPFVKYKILYDNAISDIKPDKIFLEHINVFDGFFERQKDIVSHPLIKGIIQRIDYLSKNIKFKKEIEYRKRITIKRGFKKKNISECDILFCVNSPNHILEAILLKKKIGSKFRCQIVDLFEKSAKQRFFREKIHNIAQFRPSKTKYKNIKKELNILVRTTHPEITNETIRNILAIDYLPKSFHDYFFHYLFPFLALYIGYVEEMIRQFKPKLVIINNTTFYYGRLVSHVCQKNEIKTVAYIDAPIGPIDYVFSFINADEIFCWGDESKKNLHSFGHEKEKIHVTGSVRLDQNLYELTFLEKKKYYEIHNIPNEKKIIYIINGGYLDNNLELINAVLNSEIDFTKYIPVVKPHPGEPVFHLNEYEKIVKDKGICLNESDNFYESLKHCYLVIGVYSSGLYEALYYNKKVLAIKDNQINPFDYMKMIIIPYIKIAEVKQELRKYLESDALYKEFTKSKTDFMKKVILADGKSANRVEQNIMRLINS